MRGACTGLSSNIYSYICNTVCIYHGGTGKDHVNSVIWGMTAHRSGQTLALSDIFSVRQVKSRNVNMYSHVQALLDRTGNAWYVS